MKERLPIGGRGGAPLPARRARPRLRGARTVAFAALVAALAGPTACGTAMGLRDDYTGKRFLQLGRMPGAVERDERGDPLAPGATRWRLPRLDPWRL